MSTVKTWRHVRKGLLTGVVVKDLGDHYMDIRLVGDHEFEGIAQQFDGGHHRDGEVIRVRKSLCVEVPSE